MRALIIDVRNNGGGFMDVVVDMANLFVSEGTILSTHGRTSTPPPHFATPENTYPPFPLVILVNNNSASASEILAGVLQDHGRAVIVGEQTFGKGSVQETIPVRSKTGETGMLKLTTSYWVLPSGKIIHNKGITPDRIVPMTPQQRREWEDSRRAVYSPRRATTQTATSTAPGRVAIWIDPQLEEALEILRDALTTQPSPK
jgi:carboxyl-terminal processing protease